MNARSALSMVVLIFAPSQWIMAQQENAPRLMHRAPTGEQRAGQRTTEQYRQEEAEWEANMRIEVRAIGEVGGEPIAFVYVNEEPGFVAKDVRIASWQVETVDPATQTIALRNRSKQQRILPVANPQPISFPRLSFEEYFRRREQEGWDHRQTMPIDTRSKWPALDAKAKEQLLLEALARGEVMGPRTGLHGGESSSTTLFQKEIMRRRTALREKFEASLTPEQKSDWLKYRADPAVSLRASSEERAAQLAKGKEVQERRQLVIDNLTPEQRKLYDDYRNYAMPPGWDKRDKR